MSRNKKKKSNTSKDEAIQRWDSLLNDWKATEASVAVGYADGSCLGNPGPIGYAGVCSPEDQDWRSPKTWLESVGGDINGTNNISELLAMERAFQLLAKTYSNRYKQWHIGTDSQYVIGQLEKNYKTNENKELVQKLKNLKTEYIQDFELDSITIHYTPGHRDVAGNERANELAQAEAKRQQKLVKGDTDNASDKKSTVNKRNTTHCSDESSSDDDDDSSSSSSSSSSDSDSNNTSSSQQKKRKLNGQSSKLIPVTLKKTKTELLSDTTNKSNKSITKSLTPTPTPTPSTPTSSSSSSSSASSSSSTHSIYYFQIHYNKHPLPVILEYIPKFIQTTNLERQALEEMLELFRGKMTHKFQPWLRLMFPNVCVCTCSKETEPQTCFKRHWSITACMDQQCITTTYSRLVQSLWLGF
jgi:ribonuclease HI